MKTLIRLGAHAILLVFLWCGSIKMKAHGKMECTKEKPEKHLKWVFDD